MHLPHEMDPETTALVLAAMPATGKELIRIIGLEATLSLIREFGGMEIRFNKLEAGPGADRFAAIAETVGYDNARRLAKEWLHEQVYVPRCCKAVSVLRDRAIVQDFDRMSKEQSGAETVRHLVTKYRLSYRQIETIINRTAAA